MNLKEYQEIHQDWLEDMFEFEYCGECGGDTEDHEVIPGPFGLPFAFCLVDKDYLDFLG